MTAPARILFVCHGNIFRSAFAHHRLLHLARSAGRTDLDARSAGVIAQPGNPSHPSVVAVAKTYGLDLAGHRATPLSEDLIDWATHIYIMEENMRHPILDLRPEVGGKISLLGARLTPGTPEIPDLTPDTDRDTSIRDRFDRIDRLLEHLLNDPEDAP